MARGWESKSVESQIELAEERKAAARLVEISDEEIRLRHERLSLDMARMRVVRDLEAAKHPAHRAQLQAALDHVDQKIAALGE